jgi:hypothetical protein
VFTLGQYAERMTSKTQAARSATENPVLQTLARLGFGVNGLLHVLIGVIAIGVATGGGQKADQSGALSELASAPGGVFLLWTVTIGLTALGVWLAVGAFLLPPGDKKDVAAHLAKELGKAIAYLALAGTALTFALGGSSSSSSSTKSLSADLLAAPGGVLLVVAIGLLVLGIGGYFVFKGATKRFTRDISVPTGQAGRATVAVGVAGYIAKGVALAVVGILFVIAAVTTDPSQATGLDGALKALADLPFGPVVLWVVGAGLIAYGAYCGVRAVRARL